MQAKQSDDTKSKIIEAAFELFGKNGFAGTSVRDIADKSKVNLAAINYHFQSKENLFWEVMLNTYRNVEEEIRNLSQNSKNTEELALLVFKYFLKEKYALVNAMKMMLSENLSGPQTEDQKIVIQNPMGPPGGIYFAEKIQNEVDYKLSREGALWGVKAVFGSIFHWSLMCFTKCLYEKIDPDPLMSPDQIEIDVARMIQASIDFLKNNKSLFEEK